MFKGRVRSRISGVISLCYAAAPVTPAQCRAARALLRWTIQDLSRAAEVAQDTIARYEAGSQPDRTYRKRTLRALQEALEQAGVEFLGNGTGPGVRLTVPEPTRAPEPKA